MAYRYRILPGGKRVAERAVSATPPIDTDATAADVLDAVGDDAAAAQRYLDAERKRDKPRSTLVAKLERIADA